jgi:putative transposase
MPRRVTPLVAGEIYHLYNRGVDRHEIFFERENYLFFLRRLRHYLGGKTSEVSQTSEVLETAILAYCLMPNHFHLLVQPHHDRLSRQMQRLLISYTKAINERYGRVGPLFQGQFQAVHVETSRHLIHLSRYIHLNPLTAGLVARPEDWEYSSYREYVGLRSGSLPRPYVILCEFPSRAAYCEFVEEPDSAGLALIDGLLMD